MIDRFRQQTHHLRFACIGQPLKTSDLNAKLKEVHVNTIGISYDLSNKDSKHYHNLISCIRGNYEVRLHQKSVWLVYTNESADEVQRRLSIFIDSRDKLAVFEANQSDVDRFLSLA